MAGFPKKDAIAAADDRVVSPEDPPRETETRPEIELVPVMQVLSVAVPVLKKHHAPRAGGDIARAGQRINRVGVEHRVAIRDTICWTGRVVPQTDIESEPGRRAPVVLNVGRITLQPVTQAGCHAETGATPVAAFLLAAEGEQEELKFPAEAD